MALWSHLLRQYPSQLTILPNTPATSIVTGFEAPFLVRTAQGEYAAHHVIHATNAYVSQLVPSLERRIVPIRAHMTSQRPGSLFPGSSGDRSWSVIYRGAFDYVTQRPSPGGNGDLLIGGGWSRSPSGGADTIDVVDDNEVEPSTIRYLEGVFPKLFEPNWGDGGRMDMAWSGIICVTPDGLPFVGRLPGSEDPEIAPGGERHGPAEWVSAGYNGEGMVFAFLSGAALAALVAGKENEELPSRPGIPGGKVSEWFPHELYVSSERLRREVRRDPEGVWSCSAGLSES